MVSVPSKQVQPLKQLFGILVILAGIPISSMLEPSAVLLSKQLSPSVVTPSGSEISLNSGHLINAALPISVRLSGSNTVLSFGQV